MENSLSTAAISAGLDTKLIGQNVIYFPRLSSTMDTARKEARNGAAEGTVVIAERQTAGRGRMNRPWLSPEGSIALSIILYPPKSYLPYLVMMTSLAAVHSIEKVTGLYSQIKWPNDVLINAKKVCGILIETSVKQDEAEYALVGIGINVNVKMTEFAELQDTATSLLEELGHEVSKLEMVRQLLVEMEHLYLALPAPESIYREWRSRLVTLGKKVKVTSGGAILEGTAESVTPEGNLLLRLADGGLTKVIAGDVTLRDM